MGSSGSGNATLLNIIGILDEADSGEYTLDGVEIKNLNEKKFSWQKLINIQNNIQSLDFIKKLYKMN